MGENVEYMSEEGLANLKERLKQAEAKLADLQLRRADVIGTDGDGPHDNAAFEQLVIEERGLQRTVADLKRRISRAKLIQAPRDIECVQVGSRVTIEFSDGEVETFTILGSADANPDAGVISYKSPLGSHLLGKRLGDTVTYSIGNEKITVTVKAITVGE